MAQAAVAQTDRAGGAAGEALVAGLRDQLGEATLDALLVFASPRQDHAALLKTLERELNPGALVGCSSAGEFTSDAAGEGMTCAVAFTGGDMQFSAALGRSLSEDPGAAAGQIADGFAGLESPSFRYRSALVLTDALAGFADELVDALSVRTAGVYRFFGGGAGDDARFERTAVFCGTEVASNAAVALEILSNKPLGIGVRHGWSPSSDRFRVTEAAGMSLVSLNAIPAADVFDQHATATGQQFDREAPVPFFLHNVLGVESPDGYRLRVPLAVNDDGTVACAAEVPRGATSCIMSTSPASAMEAAAEATRSALDQLEGNEPAVALFFDCVATRLRLGEEFGKELDSVQRELGQEVPFAGFNSYGQIAKAEGQFSGFHNCTAVICVIPK